MASFVDWGVKNTGHAAASGPGYTANTDPVRQNFNDAFNLFNTVNAPQQAAIDSSIGTMGNQLNALMAGYQTQTGLLNQSQNNQLAGLGLQNDALGIQRGTLDRQQALLPQQQGLANQQMDVNDQRLGLQRQGLALQTGQIDPEYARNLNAFLGGRAAAGAVTTKGTASGVSQLGQQRQNSYDQANISGQNIDLSQKSLGVERQQSALDFNEKRAALQDASKQLDISAKQTGLSHNEILNRTQQAIANLGLQTQLSVNDIFKAIADAEAGRFNPVQQFLGTIYQMTGIRPLAGSVATPGSGG